MEPITRLYEWFGEQESKRTGEITQPSNRFRPSEMGGCSRAIFYRMRGGLVVEPGRPHMYPISEDGDIGHDIVRWNLRKAGVELDWLDFDEVTGKVVETQAFKYPMDIDGKEYLISGRCDGKIKVHGRWMPLEIKTLNGFGFKYILKAYNEGRILEYLEDKYTKYLIQTVLCADSLGYDETYLIIKDRSSCQVGMHDEANDFREGLIIKNDPALLERMKKKMRSIAKSLETNTEPPRAYTEKSRECGWCPYKEMCWKG